MIMPRLPYPLDTGGRIDAFYILKSLADQGVDISVLTLSENGDDAAGAGSIRPYCQRIEIVKQPLLPKKLRYILNPVRRRPVNITKYQSLFLRKKLSRMLAEEKYDIAHFDRINVSQYVSFIDEIPCVLRLQNIDSQIFERYYQKETSPLKKWYIKHQCDKLALYEDKFYPQFDRCLVISETDGETLVSRSPSSKVSVITSGVNIEYLTAVKPEPEPASLLFLGSMDWLPNIEGSIYFCDEVLPIIQKDVPDVKLYIVGTNPDPKVRALGDRPGITVTGAVPDVRPYLAKATAMVAPIRIGSGLRIKLLEAMAFGLPTVTTTIGCEGIPVESGRQLFIADEPDKFAADCLNLIREAEVRERMIVEGRKLMYEKYNWNEIAKKIISIYEEIIAAR